MNKRRAYEEVTIAHGDHAVTLRPSLRAVTILEDKFGLSAIEKGLAELNFTIISEIILTLSTSRQDAAAFLSSLRGRPLSPFFASVHGPLAELVSMFAPAPEKHVQTLDTPSTGTRIPFSECYRNLYRNATGGLGWTPEAAWSATPNEIAEACIGKFGTDEDDKRNERQPEAYTLERLKQIDKQGFDPAFDRDRLRSLKGQGRRA